MLIVETIAKIRRDYYLYGKGLRRIARERKVSRNTVRKVIRENKTQFTYERTIQTAAENGRLRGSVAVGQSRVAAQTASDAQADA